MSLFRVLITLVFLTASFCFAANEASAQQYNCGQPACCAPVNCGPSCCSAPSCRPNRGRLLRCRPLAKLRSFRRCRPQPSPCQMNCPMASPCQSACPCEIPSAYPMPSPCQMQPICNNVTPAFPPSAPAGIEGCEQDCETEFSGDVVCLQHCQSRCLQYPNDSTKWVFTCEKRDGIQCWDVTYNDGTGTSIGLECLSN